MLSSDLLGYEFSLYKILFKKLQAKFQEFHTFVYIKPKGHEIQ